MIPGTDLKFHKTYKKMLLHNALLQTRAKILHLLILTAVLAAILNFTQRSKEVSPILFAMDLRSTFPYLTPYQILKTENLFPDSFFTIIVYSS